MTSHSSIESLARKYANKHSEDELKTAAQLAANGDPEAAEVYALALQIRDEDRSLMASLAATDYMGAAVYALRPNGKLPGDPVGVEQ